MSDTPKVDIARQVAIAKHAVGGYWATPGSVIGEGVMDLCRAIVAQSEEITTLQAALDEAQREAAIWQPIATAPKMRTILLFAVTDFADDGTVRNWKMATGSWHTGYEDARSVERGYTPWNWAGEQLKRYQVQPTHWRPLPGAPTAALAPQDTPADALFQSQPREKDTTP